MSKQKLFPVLSIAVLLALLMAAVLPLAAFAQDETPPGGEPVVVQEAPAEEEVPAEEPAPVEPAAEESAPAEPVAEEQPAEEITIPEVLEQLPEDAELVIVDAEGEVVPLASVEAVEIVSKNDPIWCPDSAMPGNGCTPAFDTVTELVGYISNPANGVTGAGTIYFTSTYNVNDFSITQRDMPNLTDLTIQGGWNGQVGNDAALGGNTTFTVPIDITWQWSLTPSTVTLRNVTVTGVTVGPDGESSAGGAVTADGKIFVYDSVFSNNVGDGVHGSTGLYLSSEKSIYVENVQANRNAGSGMDLYGPLIEVVNSQANWNDGVGIEIPSPWDGGMYADRVATLTNVELTCNTGGQVATTRDEDWTGWTVTSNVPKGGCSVNGGGGGCGGGTPVNDDPKPNYSLCHKLGSSAPSYCDSILEQEEGERIIPVPTPYDEKNLPADLPENIEFLYGVRVILHWNTPDGDVVDEKPNNVPVSIEIPEEFQGESIRVLYWDDKEWVEVKPIEISKDGKEVRFSVDEKGQYAIVSP